MTDHALELSRALREATDRFGDGIASAIREASRPLVIIAFMDAPYLLDRCLQSVAAQDDGAFDVCIVDDYSSERGCWAVAHAWADPRGWKVQHNPEHYGTLRSQVTGIRSMEMDDAAPIIVLDGDDAFAHERVVSTIRRVFADPMLDVSFGNYESVPYSPTCPPVRPIPASVCREGRYREWARTFGTCWNHARCYRRRIFDEIPDSHYIKDGEWLQAGGDHATMTAALELAGGRHAMLSEVLISYTSDRPEAEWRTRADEVQRNCEWVYSRPPLKPLPAMEWPPA